MKRKTVAIGVLRDPDDGQYLMGKRLSAFENPDTWEFIGGSVEDKETPEQAIIREFKEELNIDVKVESSIMTCLCPKNPDKYLLHFMQVSMAKETFIDPLGFHPEHSEISWFRDVDILQLEVTSVAVHCILILLNHDFISDAM